MGGIFGADIRLQRENERLKQELARERADNLELMHHNAGLKEDVTQWKAYGQSLGGYGQSINMELKHLREQVRCLADSQGRDEKAVMAQIDEMNEKLDNIANTETKLGQDIQTVVDALKAIPNPPQDLTAQLSRLDQIAQTLIDTDAQTLTNLPPTPEPPPQARRQP